MDSNIEPSSRPLLLLTMLFNHNSCTTFVLDFQTELFQRVILEDVES